MAAATHLWPVIQLITTRRQFRGTWSFILRFTFPFCLFSSILRCCLCLISNVTNRGFQVLVSGAAFRFCFTVSVFFQVPQSDSAVTSACRLQMTNYSSVTALFHVSNVTSFESRKMHFLGRTYLQLNLQQCLDLRHSDSDGSKALWILDSEKN